MSLPVYILIRTSSRPRYFARMMETVKQQTHKPIITIVHSDDPRDEYVTGDIILRLPAYGLEYGTGSYNLYNNRLLAAIPSGPGWYHFLDDDDEYAAPDVIERLVKASKRDHINVSRVERIMRRGKCIFPEKWGTQKSFQTECFFLHTDHKAKAQWWGNRGGDHHYSKQLTKILPTNWIENLLICRAQEAKGFGNRLDMGGKRSKRHIKGDKEVCVLGLVRNNSTDKKMRINQGEFRYLPYDIALELEKAEKVKITYPPLAGMHEKKPVRQLYQFK